MLKGLLQGLPGDSDDTMEPFDHFGAVKGLVIYVFSLSAFSCPYDLTKIHEEELDFFNATWYTLHRCFAPNAVECKSLLLMAPFLEENIFSLFLPGLWCHSELCSFACRAFCLESFVLKGDYDHQPGLLNI